MAYATPIDELRDRSPAAWLRERDIDLLICSELWAEGSPLRRLFAGRWERRDRHLRWSLGVPSGR